MIEYVDKHIWIVSYGKDYVVCEQEAEFQNLTHYLDSQEIQYIVKEEDVQVPIVTPPPIIEGKLFGGGLV